MPEGSGSHYIARPSAVRRRPRSPIPEGAPPRATWNTYIWVDSADETAEKVRAAGGTVLTGALRRLRRRPDGGLPDPEGAVFSLWQPKGHRGATVVNQHGAVNFNDLNTRDPEGAKAFYGAVFGWKALEVGDDFTAWSLPAYGDFLESINPGTRERNASMGAPEGFETVVASLITLGDDQADTPPHWNVTFGVDDADAAAAKVTELGGTVVAGPFDAPWTRHARHRRPCGRDLRRQPVRPAVVSAVSARA